MCVKDTQNLTGELLTSHELKINSPNMPERDPLSGPDNAWRRLGQTDNLMTITGILWFDDKVTYEELCDRLEERLLHFDRFKQKVSGRKRRVRRPYWETVENIDIETHVYDISLPKPADDEAFQEFIGQLMSRPLDERRPLWEAYLIEDVDKGDGNAVVFRINHSIGDGFALLYVLLGLSDNPHEIELPIGNVPIPPSVERKLDREEVESAAVTAEPEEGSAAKATADGGAATENVEYGGQSVEDQSKDGYQTDSGRSADEGPSLSKGRFGALGAAAGLAKGAYDLATMEDEADVSLRGDLSTRKRAGWTDDIDLEQIKEIKRQHDATVNDVLLAVTAGAIRRLLEDRGEDTEGLELRCTVPVNLKPMAKRDEQLGNAFGLAFVTLPVGTRDLGERIEQVRDETGINKLGVEAFLMYKLLDIGGKVPEAVQDLVVEQFEDRATGIVTNVPGPLNTMEIAGSEVTEMTFWVPQAVDQGIGISLLTYDGSIRIGIAGDDNLLPEPNKLSEKYAAEIEMLQAELDS